MTAGGRCQVCGREKAITAAGGIRAHYRMGDLCAGSGARPWLEASDALELELGRRRRAQTACAARFAEHRDRRENQHLGVGFWEAWRQHVSEILRLERRLQLRPAPAPAGSLR